MGNGSKRVVRSSSTNNVKPSEAANLRYKKNLELDLPSVTIIPITNSSSPTSPKILQGRWPPPKPTNQREKSLPENKLISGGINTNVSKPLVRNISVSSQQDHHPKKKVAPVPPPKPQIRRVSSVLITADELINARSQLHKVKREPTLVTRPARENGGVSVSFRYKGGDSSAEITESIKQKADRTNHSDAKNELKPLVPKKLIRQPVVEVNERKHVVPKLDLNDKKMESDIDKISVNVEYGSTRETTRRESLPPDRRTSDVSVSSSSSVDKHKPSVITSIPNSTVQFSNQSTVYIQNSNSVTIVPVTMENDEISVISTRDGSSTSTDIEPENSTPRYSPIFNRDANSDETKLSTKYGLANGGVFTPTKFNSPNSTLSRSYTSSTLQLLTSPLRTEHQKRRWNRKLSLLTFALTPLCLASFWRLPYLTLKFGGGTFLVPFYLFMLILGFPIQYLELSIGQFSSKSIFRIWDCVPLFKGVGVAQTFLAACFSIINLAVLNWAAVYLADGFQQLHPWLNCNSSTLISQEEYFINVVVNIEHALPRNHVHFWVQCVSAAVVVALLCICGSRGLKWLGFNVALSGGLSLCLLVMWFILGMSRDGSAEGIKFLFTGEAQNFRNVEVWWQAGVQALLSCCVGFGIWTCLAAGNGFRDTVWKSSLLVHVFTLLSSLLFLLVVFSHVGGMTHDLKMNVDDLVKNASYGIMFIALFDGVSATASSDVFLILCWLTIFCVGLSSLFPLAYTIGAVVKDVSGRVLILLIVIILSTLPCLLILVENGIYALTILDYYVVSFGIICILLLHILGLGKIYGSTRMIQDLVYMQNVKSPSYLSFLCRKIYPLTFLSLLTLCVLWFVEQLLEDTDHSWMADWVIPVAFCLAFLPLLIFLVTAGIIISTQVSYGCSDKLLYSTKPVQEWGPADPVERQEWLTLEKFPSALEGIGNVATNVTLATYSDKSYETKSTGQQSLYI